MEIAYIFDELIISCLSSVVTKRINDFTLGTIAHVPGRLRVYGMNVRNGADWMCYVEAGEELSALELFLLNCICQL